MSVTEAAEEGLSPRLSTNYQYLYLFFDKCADITFRFLSVGRSGQRALLVFIDGLVQADQLDDHALDTLLIKLDGAQALSPDSLQEASLPLSHIKSVQTHQHLIDALLEGQAALLLDGHAQALLLDVKGGVRRGIQEPATEAAIRGPREGFNESIRTNTALVRFRLKSRHLKLIDLTIGRQTKTKVELAYLEDLADPEVIKEVQSRLHAIDVDSILESGYIEELIEDDPLSPFPQMLNTERPDTVAGNLLEGRFAIFVDGTPFVLLGPITFWQMMQASEDYYERWGIATLVRILRYIFLYVALFLPAMYIAISTFHQDMLPTTLLLSVAAARESIPFPALVEALMMEVTFEALREASLRLPKTVGQSVSILGALVIGQSAVQAGIISAPMVIIVSLTGIASFTIPRFSAAIAIRILRFPIMLLAGAFGLFGIVIATFWLALHLCDLRSFGVPYLSGLSPLKRDELKDLMVRLPWWRMRYRPSSYAARKRQQRVPPEMKPTPPAQ